MNEEKLKKFFILLISKSYNSDDLDIRHLGSLFIDVMYDLQLGEEVIGLLDKAEKYEGPYNTFKGEIL